MVRSKDMNKELSLLRVAFEFYPMQGGSITHIIELSKKINPCLKQQVIIAPDFGIFCSDFDKNFGIPIYRVKYSQKLKMLGKIGLPIMPLIIWKYAENVLKIINQLSSGFDFVYVHGTLLGAMLLFQLGRAKTHIPVVIVQDSADLFKINMRSALSARLAFFLFRFNKPEYFLIIDDGMGIENTTAYLHKYNIPFETINHAIDTEFFNVKNKETPYNDKFIILSTQRLDPFKRVDLGILAYKKLLERINYPENVKLLIVGDGIERRKLEALTKKENIEKFVEFLGAQKIEAVLNYLQTADVVIGTSLKSNLNLSIQEAMSCERPVVAFDSGDTRKLIKNSINGLLVAPNDLDEFADKLKLLYEDQTLRNAIGMNARKTIITERSWHTRLNKELEILHKSSKRIV